MKKSMQTLVLAAAAGLAVLTTTGCAVVRDQQTVGAYVDDATITAAIKTRFVESKAVDAGAVKVETLNGTVQLSGFAKNATEKSQAEQLARGVKGVRAVQNNLTIRS